MHFSVQIYLYIQQFGKEKCLEKNTGFFMRKTVESQNQTILVVLSSRLHHVLSVENVKSLIRDTKELVAFSNENLVGRD